MCYNAAEQVVKLEYAEPRFNLNLLAGMAVGGDDN